MKKSIGSYFDLLVIIIEVFQEVSQNAKSLYDILKSVELRKMNGGQIAFVQYIQLVSVYKAALVNLVKALSTPPVMM